MSPVRVLRLYHSGVVDEYRQRERILRARHGYDVHLVCPPEWSEGGSIVRAPAEPDIPVHVVAVRGRQHPILFWYANRALRRVLRSVRPQIVDVHEEPYSLATAGILAAVGREAPSARICLYSAQNIPKRYPPPFRQLERRALAAAAAGYPCSTEAGDVMRAKGFTGSLHVLPLGVSPVADRPPSDGRLRVGFVGRLEHYKGGDIALRAFAQVVPAHPDASLEFVGAGSAEPSLRTTARELGVASRVVFRGAVSQDKALALISRFDVLLVPSLTTPSWKEQFGRVAAQAMAAGTAVIASDSGSLREVVGDAGELVPEGDVAAFAARLEMLLADPSCRARLGQRGRQRAADHLSWEHVARECDRMYRRVLADS